MFCVEHKGQQWPELKGLSASTGLLHSCVLLSICINDHSCSLYLPNDTGIWSSTHGGGSIRLWPTYVCPGQDMFYKLLCIKRNVSISLELSLVSTHVRLFIWSQREEHLCCGPYSTVFCPPSLAWRQNCGCTTVESRSLSLLPVTGVNVCHTLVASC